MNGISPNVLLLILVAVFLYWRGGSSEAREGGEAKVVRIPAFPRNSPAREETFKHKSVTYVVLFVCCSLSLRLD